MPLWLIPMVYIVASLLAGGILPRLEREYLSACTHDMSAAAAMAFFSAVSSGMMALTGIVFAIAFLMVRFSALAYSPRLVVMFASSPTLYHTLGIFFATFIYSLTALIWTDRSGTGTVPLFSYLLATTLLMVSMLAFARLIRSINNLQINNVLPTVGSRGHAVIRAMFPQIADNPGSNGSNETALPTDLGLVTQTLNYSDDPRVITRYDIDVLVLLAQNANALAAIECGVGETLIEDTVLMRVSGTEADHSPWYDPHLPTRSKICHSASGGYRHPGPIARNQ
jgi:uncharacterized membrane protein